MGCEEEEMKIAVASDHAGYRLKEHLKARLEELGHEVVDFGAESEESSDYADFGRPASEAVAQGEMELGVLCCGTGQGMTMTANKVRGVRAALCGEPFSARMARAHNDANVLVMGGRLVGEGLADEILREFLVTEFEGGRHARRVGKIEPK
jgi:ribose 5-phosphate isomerase B